MPAKSTTGRALRSGKTLDEPSYSRSLRGKPAEQPAPETAECLKQAPSDNSDDKARGLATSAQTANEAKHPPRTQNVKSLSFCEPAGVSEFTTGDQVNLGKRANRGYNPKYEDSFTTSLMPDKVQKKDSLPSEMPQG